MNRPLRIVGVLALVAGGAAALFFIDPRQASFLPSCPLHTCTGLYCPGCGSTRALHALVHGRWGSAWRFNPLAVLALPGLAALAVWRKQMPHPAVGWSVLTIVFLFGILRNIPLESFDVLRP